MLRAGGISRAAKRLVPGQPRTSHHLRVGALAQRQGLGWPRAGQKFPDWACNAMASAPRPRIISWATAGGRGAFRSRGGDVSIGVVFDQRRVQWPRAERLGSGSRTFSGQASRRGAKSCVTRNAWRATCIGAKNLPYYSTTHAGDGFILVGDAAAFMDPFYSPGMDWISFTRMRRRKLIWRSKAARTTACWCRNTTRISPQPHLLVQRALQGQVRLHG